MKYFRWILALFLAISFIPFQNSALASSPESTIPTFSITTVVRDTSVSIYTYNFPANTSFDVLMNYYGTQGKNGIKVNTINSGKGGSFPATFSIPVELRGLNKIAIRLQNNTGSGYYAYNWFYNSNATSGGSSGGSTGGTIPTFSITSVDKNKTVSIYTYNFPKNDNFDVLMNYYGTLGVNGYKVGTIASGKGGSFAATFNIPPELKGQQKIAIRLQSNTGSGYYAYNWFYNATTNGSKPGNGGGNSGIPTISISSVVRNKTVTLQTHNFPANQSFTVLMNYIGTQGKNGIKVGTINSGDGGSFSATFNIPSELKGQYQIAIRLQSSSGYYAYNWFYNVTTP